MNEKEKQKQLRALKRYAMPHHEDHTFAAAFMGIGLIGGAAALYDGEYRALPLMIVFMLFGVFFLRGALKQEKAYRSKFETIEESGKTEALLDDFEHGVRAFGGSLILGKSFLIGQRSGEIVAYSMINRLYQYIESDALFENKRDLRLELKNGHVTDVGKIPLRGKGNEEYKQVIEYICSVQPSVKVGYNG